MSESRRKTMNQNLTYTTYTTDPRGGPQQSQSNQDLQMSDLQGIAFHPSSYQTTTYTTSTSAPYGSSNNFISNNGTILQQGGRSNQTIRLAPPEQESKNSISSMMETYFIEPSTSSTWNTPTHTQQNQTLQLSSQLNPQISYQNGTLVTSTPGSKVVSTQFQTVIPKMGSSLSPDKAEKERMKKARQAEAARMRYHRLTPQQKRELNLKRTLAQKRKRQREKELEELDSILRETNDIQEDPDITEQLREKRMRAKWAEAARARYARMSVEERKAHNNRRRMRQMQNALAAVKAAGGTGDPGKDEEAVRQHIKMQNAKKAEAARMRYHRMTDEEKRLYNQRRTEAFRRRRMEEEMLLAMPIGRITGDALDRAQQIVVRNAKRAEAARARYQRMTPDQRKSYNQKRYTPKRRSGTGSEILGPVVGGGQLAATGKKEEMDALSALEREVLKRTQQAQQALKRQQNLQQQQQMQSQSGSNTPGPSQQGGSYIIQPGQTVTHIVPQQGMQIQLAAGNSGHQQVVHGQPQHHMQTIQTQGGHIITQQQGGFQTLPTSQPHVVVQHQQQQPPTSGHLVVYPHQVTHTSNGNMMISGQMQSQQVMNPYSQRN